jgi:hypothetical protein
MAKLSDLNHKMRVGRTTKAERVQQTATFDTMRLLINNKQPIDYVPDRTGFTKTSYQHDGDAYSIWYNDEIAYLLQWIGGGQKIWYISKVQDV